MYTVNNFKNYVPFSLIDLNSFKAKIEQKIFLTPSKNNFITKISNYCLHQKIIHKSFSSQNTNLF